MVDFLGRGKLISLLTLLTERMRLDVAVTDTFPCTTISFVGLRVTSVLVVELVCFLQMLGAVLLTNLSEEAATGIGTRPFWFVWHCVTSFGIKKSPTGVTCKACVILF